MTPQNPDKALMLYPISDLAKAGATFTLCYPRSKTPIGEGWQNRPHDAAEAEVHLLDGGNVGILCGTHSADLIVIDVDSAADDFALQYPELTRWAFWRDNARDRAKYLVRVDGGHVHSRKTSGLEIFATGGQAIIAGIHETGAAIHAELEGDVPTVTADDIAAVYEDWTGQGYHNAPIALDVPSGVTVDADALLDAAVRAGMPGNRHNAGFALARILRDNGTPQDEALAIMRTYADCVEWAHGAAHAYTRGEAERTLISTYKGKRSSQGSADSVISAVERAIVDGDILVSANVQKTLFGCLAIMRTAGRVHNVALPVRDVARIANVPRSTVARHLYVLSEHDILKPTAEPNYVKAREFTLCAKVGHTRRVDKDIQRVSHSGTTADSYHTLQCEPACAIGARVHPHLATDDDESRMSSFGATVQRILSVLLTQDVEGVGHLRELTHTSKRTLYRKLATLRRYGVVDGDSLALAADWRERLDEVSIRLTSYGQRELRARQDDGQRAALHNRSLRFTQGEQRTIAQFAARRAEERIPYWDAEIAELNRQRAILAGYYVPGVPDNNNVVWINTPWREPRKRRIRLPKALYKPGFVSGVASEAEKQAVEEAALLAQIGSLRLEAYSQAAA